MAGATGQPFWVVAGHVWLAHERVRNGPIDEATEALEAAVAQMRAIGLSLGRVYHLATLARCHARVAHMAQAEKILAEAEDGIRAGRDLLYGPEVLRLKAEIMSLGRQTAGVADADREILDCLDAADAAARRMGARAWSALIAGSRARRSGAPWPRDGASAARRGRDCAPPAAGCRAPCVCLGAQGARARFLTYDSPGGRRAVEPSCKQVDAPICTTATLPRLPGQEKAPELGGRCGPMQPVKCHPCTDLLKPKPSLAPARAPDGPAPTVHGRRVGSFSTGMLGRDQSR